MFHRYDDKERLHVKEPNKRRPPNPLRGYTGRQTASDSSVGSCSVASTIRRGTQESKKLLYQLNFTDQRSFITGSCTASMQACHLINAVRIKGSEEKRRDLKEIKDRVESIATRQAFNGNRPFLLDSRPNAILLRINEHYDLDLYGNFAIIPTLDHLVGLLGGLLEINRKWDDLTKQNPHAERPLPINEYPFAAATLKWALLVLNLDDFLPDGEPLMVLADAHRTLRMPGNAAPAPSPRESWIPLYTSSTSPYLIKADNQPFNEFSVPLVRDPHDQLSVLAIVVNAHSKVKAFMKNSPDSPRRPSIAGYWDTLERIIDQIFYVPSHHLPLVPGALAANDVEIESTSTTTSPSTPTTPKANTSMLPNAGNSFAADDGQHSGQSNEEPFSQEELKDDDSSSESSESDSDSDSDSDSEDVRGPPEIIHENGLTSSEHKILFERASDASLPARERADAAVMMMMGVRGYQRPFRSQR